MKKNVPDIPLLFGENLRKLRKSKGFTQEELSEKLEITQKHLSMLETGTQFASAQLISKICGVLDIEPAELFSSEISVSESNRLFSRLATLIENKMATMQALLIEEIRNNK